LSEDVSEAELLLPPPVPLSAFTSHFGPERRASHSSTFSFTELYEIRV
jgi:hypothetical protein